MVAEPTLDISIDRTGMTPSTALTFSATPGVGKRGVANYQEPRLSVQAELLSAPDIHGDRLRSWKWQQAILAFDVVLDDSDDEDEVTDLTDEIRTAISRMSFAVTVTKNGGTPQVWSCRVGEVNFKAPRSRNDLQDSNPVLEVLIPCHPVRS